MSKQKEIAMIPALRFPEFSREAAWSSQSLGTILLDRRDKGFESLPLLSLTDKDGIILQEESNRKNNSSSDKSKYLRVCKGDVAYNTMRMWEGRSAYVTIEGLVSPAYTVCKPIKGHSGLFFSYYFKTNPLINLFHMYSQGIVKDTLNLKYEAFSKIEAPIPLPDEQEKIADCLDTIDVLISAQTQKLEALKNHKKGLMQNLFPVEGQTNPNFRFPEFMSSGSWSSSSLDSPRISTFVKDRVSLAQLDIESYVSTENLLPDYAGVVKASKLPPSGSFTSFKVNDILISNIRPYLKKVWAADTEGASSNDVIVVRAGLEMIPTYLLYVLKNDAFINYVMKSAKGVKMPRGDLASIKKYCVAHPKEEEQQKIADCLSSIDNLIISQSQKIETLKQQKKGLMQQLFPHINESVV